MKTTKKTTRRAKAGMICPGKWEISGDADGSPARTIYAWTEDRKLAIQVCRLIDTPNYMPEAVRIATANLLCAAPGLLKVAKLALHHWPAKTPADHEMRRILSEAIAKAEHGKAGGK